MESMEYPISLKSFFTENPRVALAFSGGVDSSFLLYAAKQYAERVTAYYVKTAFQPFFELEDALRLSRELGVKMRVLTLDVLSDEEIAANPPDRCYHCKRRLFSAIAEKAAAEGFDTLIDGTNADDDESDRPGMRALDELCVLSPLRLCGLKKAEIRELSREAGLFTWDKPAYACLATRQPAGEYITREALSRTEEAESFLSSLGFSDFRIRTREGNGLLQLTEEGHALLKEREDEVLEGLLRYYPAVSVDPEVRREH